MLNLSRENDFRKFIHLEKSFSKVDSFPYKIYRETLLILFKLEKKTGTRYFSGDNYTDRNPRRRKIQYAFSASYLLF